MLLGAHAAGDGIDEAGREGRFLAFTFADYRKYWLARFFATFALQMVVVAVGWQIYDLTRSAFDLGLVGFSGMVLIFCLWWMYFLMPSGESLHLHRERAWGWGYGHFVLFAATAAVGSGLEVVADVLGAVENGAHLAEGASNRAHHGVSSLYAISMVAIAEATFVIALWALHRHATRSNARHLLPTLLCLGTIGLGPLAAFWGLPLAWSLLLLSLGPVALIIYHEHGRRHCTDHFAVR